MMSMMSYDTSAGHRPVLLSEVIEALRPKIGQLFVDGTFGNGGYSRAVLESGADVVAIDRDPTVRAAATRMVADYDGRFAFKPGRFSEMAELVARPVDGVVLDIGVSSMQIDTADRGFSFMRDGPLDMRMGSEGPNASDLVNELPPEQLISLFRSYGEERQAGRIARAIARRRDERRFERTGDLAELVEKTIGRKPGDRIHPATRIFQALRIAVNDELGELVGALHAAEALLKPGGRLVVVSFHSLEDRIVKRFVQMRSNKPAVSRHLPPQDAPPPTFRKNGATVTADAAEAASNPRARSAILRSAIRTEAPAETAAELSAAALGLPDVQLSIDPEGGV